jgi:ubiquitin-protein ligase
MSATINKRVIKDIRDGMVNLKDEFGIYIAPEEKDFYKVHFILPGPEDTSFEGGLYHGMIRLNANHPHGAPNIHMITPSGRFVPESYPIPNGSRGICTTSTAFHPETWTPMNNIETVLKGFISLMCDPYDGGIGGMKSTPDQTKKLAKKSLDHIKSDPIVKELFSELHENLVNGTYKPVKLGDLCKNINTAKTKKTLVTKKPKKSKKIDDSESDSSDKSEESSGSDNDDDDIVAVSDSDDEKIKPNKNPSKKLKSAKTKKNKIEPSDEEISEESPQAKISKKRTNKSKSNNDDKPKKPTKKASDTKKKSRPKND